MPTYVDITRSEIEDWLNTMPRFRGKWRLSDGTAGIYLLPLSANVAIKFSSTVGSRDEGMKRGRASAQLRLVSLVTGRVLNKKAQGQRGFFRTINWRDNWKKGIDTFVAVYTKSTAFYERIALPEDQQEQPAAPAAAANMIPASELGDYLNNLRFLYLAVREAGDTRSADFLASVGKQVKDSNGRRPSEKQRNWMENLTDRYWDRAEEIKAQRGGVARRAATLAERFAKRKLSPESWKRWKAEHPGAREQDFEITEPKDDKGKNQSGTEHQQSYKDTQRALKEIGHKDPFGEGAPEQSKKLKAIRKELSTEVQRVVGKDPYMREDRKKPDPQKLVKLLKEYKGMLYPLGGHIMPGGRKLNKLIKSLGGKKASRDLFALYQAVEAMLAEDELIAVWRYGPIAAS